MCQKSERFDIGMVKEEKKKEVNMWCSDVHGQITTSNNTNYITFSSNDQSSRPKYPKFKYVAKPNQPK